MALWQLDAFKPAQFLGFIQNLPPVEGFERQRYLPNEGTDDLDFEYIVGAGKRTVMAHFMGYDAEAPIGGRPGLGSKVRGSLVPIKRKAVITEKELAKFYSPRLGSSDIANAIRSVYTTAADLAFGVEARLEQIAFHALSLDSVLYDEGGLKFRVDFGIRDDFQFDLVTGTDDNDEAVEGVAAGNLKDTENFNLLPWMRAICDRVQQRTGRRPTEWTMSAEAATYIFANKSLKTLIRGEAAPDAILTEDEYAVLRRLYNLPAIHTYDAIVTGENADGSYFDERAMPVNRSFLTNGTPLGKTLFGPTAESRVIFGTPIAALAQGIWAETYGTTEPPAEWTKVAAAAFPTIPGAGSIAQVRLWAEDGDPEDAA